MTGREKAIAVLFWVLFIAVILAVAVGARLWIAGGDVDCVFAQDPALCVVVKDIGR